MIDYDRIFSLLDEFVDQEMNFDLLDDFEKEFEEFEDEFFRCCFNTLVKTVEMCNDFKMIEVPEPLHLSLIEVIKTMPQSKIKARKRKKNLIPKTKI